ncbi:MAG: hypothetical protein QM762_12735 [Chryseolinea sp.]
MSTKTKAAVKEKEMTISMYEAYFLQGDINSCAKAGVGADTFLKLIELLSSLEEIGAKRYNAVKAVMNAYGITKPVASAQGGVEWAFKGHPKEQEIVEKVKAVNNQKVTLKPVKFMSAEELHQFTSLKPDMKPFTMGEILSLSKVLLDK